MDILAVLLIGVGTLAAFSEELLLSGIFFVAAGEFLIVHMLADYRWGNKIRPEDWNNYG